jgi:hypothetical protein
VVLTYDQVPPVHSPRRGRSRWSGFTISPKLSQSVEEPHATAFRQLDSSMLWTTFSIVHFGRQTLGAVVAGSVE